MEQQKLYLEKNQIYLKYIKSILNEERKTRSELEMQYKEIGNIDIFTIFNSYISDIEKELFGSNAKIVYFNRYIYHSGERYIEDMKSIDNFINEVSEMQQKSSDKIAKYNFDILQRTLANIRENIRIKLTEE